MYVSRRLWDERDRRYTEVAAERERALQIKQRADEEALRLAREIQAYKDEKANDLRAQIESERGIYLRRDEYETKHDALIAIVGGVAEQITEVRTGGSAARRTTSEIRALIFAVIMAFLALGTLLAFIFHP